jgi:hypothetical protein
MTGKRFNVFDVDGTIFLEDHKEGSYHIGEIGNVDVNCLNDIADRLNELAEENIKQQTQIKKVLKKQLDYYTERALLLNQPYGDVTEAIHDIANELGVDL